mmetsp:Transcript_26002/g.85563  ORF Transcript_26002/g.85563 Transcript_26002/m.85563 type:complete len:232 (+) Transcript_26002:1716-2411(+)
MAQVVLRLSLPQRALQQLQVGLSELKQLENSVARHGNQVVVRRVEAALVHDRVRRHGCLHCRQRLCRLPRPDGEVPLWSPSLRHEQLRVWRKAQGHKLLGVGACRRQQPPPPQRVEVEDRDNSLIMALSDRNELLVRADGQRRDLFSLVGAREESLYPLLEVEDTDVVPNSVQDRLFVDIAYRLAHVPLDTEVVSQQKRRHCSSSVLLLPLPVLLLLPSCMPLECFLALGL